jgi:hypothetical protein
LGEPVPPAFKGRLKANIVSVQRADRVVGAWSWLFVIDHPEDFPYHHLAHLGKPKRESRLSHLLPLTTKLILLDSLLQEVEATLPHLVLQKDKE